MSKARILYVEDDETLSQLTQESLHQHGYQVDHAAEGEAALHLLKHHSYDLIILDGMLPKLDGFGVAKNIRQRDKEVPILFLSAKSLKEDRIQGLKTGADDYITKPFPEKRFQFYDILPGKADAVPDKAGKPEVKKEEPKKEEKKEEPKKEEVKESKTPLFLQAGSFSTAQDADNQKAKLAFMGIEAVIQQVMIQDKTFYRVRVGPFTRIDELNKTRAELAKNGIDAQLAKNKE